LGIIEAGICPVVNPRQLGLQTFFQQYLILATQPERCMIAAIQTWFFGNWVR